MFASANVLKSANAQANAIGESFMFSSRAVGGISIFEKEDRDWSRDISRSRKRLAVFGVRLGEADSAWVHDKAGPFRYRRAKS